MATRFHEQLAQAKLDFVIQVANVSPALGRWAETRLEEGFSLTDVQDVLRRKMAVVETERSQVTA